MDGCLTANSEAGDKVTVGNNDLVMPPVTSFHINAIVAMIE